MTEGIEVARRARKAARAEAAVWVARLHGAERTPQLEAGLRRWLAADEENARQFERVTEVWDSAAGVPAGSLPRMANRVRTGKLPVLAWASFAAACCVAIVLLGYRFIDPSSYHTAIGEQRLVRLEDGSRVTLNSDTRIRVAYREGERRVRLERGEAFFEVAQKSGRPFVVVAGDREVTALGTSFVVRYERARTSVTLVEGRIAVAGPPDNAEKSKDSRVLLSPGERLTLSSGRVAVVDEPKVDVVTAWRRGELVLDHTPLAEAVAEMNRYQDTSLVIDDAATASLPVSGIYQIGDSEAFARAVARLYGLQLAQRGDKLHVSAR